MKKTKSITLFSNKKSPDQAAYDLIEQADDKLDFKPDLALFYATLKYHGKYQSMLDILNDEYGDIPQIGASVDGMIYPDDMRADGAALVLCEDDDARIRVDGVKGNSAIGSAEKLAAKVKCEYGVVVLHFPLVHVPGAIKIAQFIAKGFYYSKKIKIENLDKQKKSVREFSNYCDRENILYQPPAILDLFARQTNYKVPIIGINVLHTQVRTNSPNIFCNFEDIDGGITALTIEKKNINAIYDDIFPDKGKTLDETKHIVSNEFKIIKEFNAKFEKNVLISLNDKPPTEAVKNLIYISDEKEKELHDHLDKGDFKVQMPYELLFLNKQTNGAFLLGIGSYFPFELFPFFMDISDYSEDVALVYENIDDKFDAFISCLNNLKYDDGRFVYFSMDVGAAAAFGKKTFEYKDKVNKLLGNNYFGIMSAPSSAYIPPEFRLRNYLSETHNNTFFMGAGTSSCLEI
ncbi:MAG: hypothetical protein OIN84_01075 [Candidatus Methanoperedens sp.]|uniref:FIST N-terminal domain-containing protein n=1 Tax=Candidatus Methanoperedens sp. BLZ2 TaxID=2035255 RepID=UPI000BE369BA|nr:FIST N-terminal domain-containing protein [Candidatus Methanoperedens sp. BLZ2]KAB2946036.1 MAG: hypothetical protein F9K14_08760 [Candidatus Methanoperedens sp.]MBZ0175272.1 hypothetical protein [Candidatus Methanoperedens nitroreducens]MCX9076546.1 hypothetical protein [Candidatus Methanoperedens sp.]